MHELLPPTLSGWLALLASYLLGAIPFGLLLGKLVGGVDIRRQGSGNIGATNVGRALGRPWAITAFAFDCAKGWAPAFFLPLLLAAESPHALRVGCGFAAVCGHVWPLYLGFRGGKGVATLCGAVLAVDPMVFLGGGVVWLATLVGTRYVGLASMLMGLSFPFLAAWRLAGRAYAGEVIWGTALLSALVFVRHRANIGRMLAGTEPKAGRRRTT
ncbi:MAG: glycerol-3-phosphate 1-O-acyltransferase PlsY [Planctomycetes bacterium]|nr:glycerol-3-phosphate 1-O-acyltransferase PlsY [Planctomycetota bacterium]